MRHRRRGVTIIELLIVLAIVGLLATIAVTVLTGHILRARIAATAAEIHELSMACTAYEVDTGQFPVSSSGTQLAPDPVDPSNAPGEGALGCGYLITCLTLSLTGDPANPASPLWKGPYIQLNRKRLGTLTGERLDPDNPLEPPQIQLLDRWGNPYYYVRGVDYESFLGTVLPPGSPFPNEIYFNPSTIQIVSWGPNGISLPRPDMGTDFDDITNFPH